MFNNLWIIHLLPSFFASLSQCPERNYRFLPICQSYKYNSLLDKFTSICERKQLIFLLIPISANSNLGIFPLFSPNCP